MAAKVGASEKQSLADDDGGASREPAWKLLTMAYSTVLLENKYFSNFMTALTLYALFGDDIRLACTTVDADVTFWSLSAIALIFFCVELGSSCLAKSDYLFSFYFWLDFVSTISLLPDIGFIEIPGLSTSSQGDALKAGRGARAGSKASRIIRLVRLVRMVRVVKLYKMHGGGQDVMAEQRVSALEPSKVGKKLTEMTTRRLIVMILTMVLILPFFYLANVSEDMSTRNHECVAPPRAARRVSGVSVAHPGAGYASDRSSARSSALSRVPLTRSSHAFLVAQVKSRRSKSRYSCHVVVARTSSRPRGFGRWFSEGGFTTRAVASTSSTSRPCISVSPLSPRSVALCVTRHEMVLACCSRWSRAASHARAQVRAVAAPPDASDVQRVGRGGGRDVRRAREALRAP